ncbi:TonB-dependent receptor plug domain-containing protein [Sporolituus thermophilus]|uniref:Vitamin B12 transporter n=1 Tax=Sporolituus thermophilus DSM 23256 TaxID=1123285 RepID=A0A1G7HIW5_9FIRM|nr:TonB-dependent receptor [Sporolituus thermophilus]SDF00266.1 vitamin B12 transporter [Sporolituus thermophilus DSM 23256]
MSYGKKFLTKRIASALAVGTLLVASPAFAAEEPVFQLDQITVTAARVPQALASTPADVTVITGEQLEQKGARNLADALEGVPGVVVKKQGGAGEFATVYINDSDRTVVMVDGKRLNLPQGAAYGRGPLDFSTIIGLDNIERIEVVRGGGSTLYGSDAVGGVINIITKKGAGSVKTILDIGGGNNGTFRSSIVNQGEERGFRWYITGAKDKTDGQRPNNQYDGKNATVRLDKDLSSRENLTVTYDYYGSHAGIPGWMNQVNGNYVWNTSSSLTDYADVLRQNWGATYTFKQGTTENILRYYNNSQTYVGRNGVDFRHRNEVKALEYQQNLRLNPNQTITWGADWRSEEVDSTNENGLQRRHVRALYLQDQYTVNDYWQLTTGLRYDDNSQYGNKLLPKLAVNYRADDRTNYFASWGKVFKPPTFDDLYWYSESEWGIYKGDPNLKPETGWTAEFGVKKRLDTKSEAMVSLFKRELNDAIRWNGTSPANIDNFRSSGVNLTYATKLSNAVTAGIGYSYLHTETTDPSVRDPHHNLYTNLNVRYGKLNQTLSVNYLSESGVGNSKVSGRVVVDTTASYDLGEGQSLYLTVNNLFNKRYQEVAGYPAQERTIFLGLKQSL